MRKEKANKHETNEDKINAKMKSFFITVLTVIAFAGQAVPAIKEIAKQFQTEEKSPADIKTKLSVTKNKGFNLDLDFEMTHPKK